MNIIFHYDAGPGLKDRLAEFAKQGLNISIIPVGDEDGFRAALSDCDVLWHVLEPVTRTHIETAPKLHLIQKIGVGVNTIDLHAAEARGIPVCNMPGTNSQAVAEQTLMLMLSALRQASQFDRLTRAGLGWDYSIHLQDQLSEVCGKTVGFVGFGEIPKRLVPVLKAMGAEVIYTAKSPKNIENADYVDLQDLLRRSDILSLHIPLTEATDKLINADAISKMKTGSVLVNTARGGVVDQVALIDALSSGKLSAAGLDVFEDEPLSADSPLNRLENVTLSPHIGWLTRETMDRSFVVAVENCLRLRDGRDLLHRVI